MLTAHAKDMHDAMIVNNVHFVFGVLLFPLRRAVVLDLRPHHGEP